GAVGTVGGRCGWGGRGWSAVLPVIAFGGGSSGVLLVRHVPGEALRAARGPQPVRDAGRLLRRLHALPAEPGSVGPPRVRLGRSEDAPAGRAPSSSRRMRPTSGHAWRMSE